MILGNIGEGTVVVGKGFGEGLVWFREASVELGRVWLGWGWYSGVGEDTGGFWEGTLRLGRIG